MATLHEKLVKLQNEIVAQKSNYNSFGKYSYRSAEDIISAFKEANDRLKLGLYLKLSDELVLIGDRYYIKATASITDGTSVESVSAFAREESEQKGMSSAQLTGSTSSYSRKYAMAGLLGLDDEKDDDHRAPRQHSDNAQTTQKKQYNNTTPAEQGEQAAKQDISKATDAQKKAMYAISKKKGIELPKIDTWHEAAKWIEEQNKR